MPEPALDLPQRLEHTLQEIRDESSFVERLLIDTLGWDLPPEARRVEDLGYDWTADELRAAALDAKVVDAAARQIMVGDTAWGVFLLEFEHPEAFTTGRGLTGPLRQVLRGLVRKLGRDPNLPAFRREHLLFIATYRFQHYRFAYFKNPPEAERPATPLPTPLSSTPPLAMFGWNRGERDLRTLCEMNLPRLAQGQDWAEAFDVERVTARFFADYRQVFGQTERLIGESNPSLDADDLRMFTQTLMNRLLFVRFLERKGWLTFNDRHDYLQALHAAGDVDGKSLYRSRLRPLFFDALAKLEADRPPGTADRIGDVPFLNGGLFEPTALDEEVVDVPDVAFDRILAPADRDGLFYKYHFTVAESTPLDIEVAVDPEMLGKVFEELVTGRHESGSYYTPRPIVAFMCREAIKGYLTGLPTFAHMPHVIQRLVDDHEVTPDLTLDHADTLRDALDRLRGVDPACGSGAYLLGLLQEMIALYSLLYNQRLTRDPRSLFDLKLHIISRSLYGTDIDPFATSIAMLRLWLSLSIEADAPTPLPNLDFKIETGDALLGPDPQAVPDLFRAQLRTRADVLVHLKDKYLRAHGREKAKARAAIEKEEADIRGRLEEQVGPGIIDWRVQFAEAFRPPTAETYTYDGRFGFAATQGPQSSFTADEAFTPGGFDIVLANPPYVRQEGVKRLGIKPRLKATYPHVYTGVADLYVYFYARAVQLLAPGGMLVFISSNKWFRAGYGSKLRDYLATNTRTRSITDFGSLPVFNAVAYPMIYITRKGDPTADATGPWHTRVDSLDPPYPDIKALIAERGERLAPSAVAGATWTLLRRDAAAVLDRMRAVGTPLGEYVDGQIYRGVLTGFNKAFIIDGRKRAELIEEDPRSGEVIKPLIIGDDIERWRIARQDRWLIVTPIGIEITNYPAIFDHLSQWQEKLEKRYDKGNHWWELRACTYYDAFDHPKILYQEIATYQRFALDRSGGITNNKVFMIPSDSEYLLAVMNSRPVWLYLKNTCQLMLHGALAMQSPYVLGAPIPPASESDRGPLRDLARRCLDAKAADPSGGGGGAGVSGWEREIDERVAALYGLDVRDVASVEES